MIDLEDEKERILEQLAAMVADASVKPELRLKAAGMVLGHERGKAAPAKDEGAAEPEVLRFFFGRLKPLGDWQEKLAAKFRADFGDSL